MKLSNNGANAARYAIATVIGLLLFTAQMKFGNAPAGASLDASWQAVLNWGILHGAQWGRDLVFTYGPLGFLSPDTPFDPQLYWTWLALETCLALICAWLAASAVARLPLVLGIAYLLVTWVLAIGWSSSALWIMTYPLAFLMLSRYAENDANWRGFVIVAALAALEALLPLLKFSAFPLWLLWVPAGCAMFALARRPVLAMVFLLASLIAPVIAWLICGQHLSNLPAFFGWSWQIALYYGGALQAPPKHPSDDVNALMALLIVLLILAAAAWRGRHRPPRLICAIVLAAAAGLAYRAGTLRADDGHLLIFWSACAWIAVLAAGLWLATVQLDVRTRAAAFIMALLPLMLLRGTETYPARTYRILYSGKATVGALKSSLRQIADPQQAYAYRMRLWEENRHKLALPQIDAMVGRQPVDLLTHQQGALLANDLNYDPRPVFQSYSAYSDELSRLNAAFFGSRNAPPWVILAFGTIDDNFPTADDARALPRILQDYRPLISEGNFLLFHRERTVPHALDDGHPVRLAASPEQLTFIPRFAQDAIFAKLDVQLTWAGKLATLLTREPALYLQTVLRDGETFRYRIPRAIARSGFMLSPTLDDKDTYINWLLGSDEHEVKSITVRQAYVWGQPVFRIAGPWQLFPFGLVRKEQLSFGLLAAYYPGFNVLPIAMSQKPRRWRVDGADALNFQAPATLVFSVPAGRYAISAHYGIAPNALDNKACLAAHPDGIGIGAGVEGQPLTASAFDYLDPFRDSAHRYAADLTRTVEVPANRRLQLTISIGPPGSNGACDWAWLRDVHINRTDNTAVH